MKKIFILILSILLLISDSFAQTTAIPDAAFETRLIQLGIDSDSLVNGQILNSDAASVIGHLDITSANISDLTGIAAFVNLDSLICSGNNLINLDVSGNPSLEYLLCYGSNITNLTISGAVALKYLNCGGNNLTSLNTSGSPALEYLDCSGNAMLTSLNLLGATSLEYLVCYFNNLVSLDISNNPALRNLYCFNNSLTSLDFSNNPDLNYLRCDNNGLTTLDFSNNPVLVRLECNNNNLTVLDVSSNPYLWLLQCNDNNLTSLDISASPLLKHLFCKNNNLTALDVSNNPALINLGCEFNNLTQLDLTNNLSVSVFKSNGNQPNMQICVLSILQAMNNSSWSIDPSTVYSEYCRSLSVEGRVVVDDNMNCIVDSLDGGLSGQMVQFERMSDTAIFYFRTYNSSGDYRAYLDTGVYTVSVLPTGPYWQVCPSSQPITIDTNYLIQTLDWALQPLVLCPLLEVDISAPFLRMTGGGSAYTISYCNNGTIAAQNAYVEVYLDTSLNFISSSIPVTSQTGRVYSFNLGTVGVGSCGSFEVQVIVDTSAQFEQTHCTEVSIYPDSICVPLWSGPIVEGTVSCQIDSVFFNLVNTGSSMLQPQSYTVIQDDIAMRTGTILLGSGQSVSIRQEAIDGHTYRIEVEQFMGFPALLGDPIFSKAIEGCNPYPDGSFNVGFVTQYSNGHSAPFRAIDCQQNIASYDPNDKSAQPAGYGLSHYIEQNVSIDYKVRFQNTGTDTAFNIVILDTLSSYVSTSSLQMGASSHNYTWEIVGGNVLKVSFPNIMLVDSNANEPLSHGFFRYGINQENNNPLGSLIENQAAIYFDYNPPIFTNTTFHTIGENFVPVMLSVEDVYVDEIAVSAFPNPFNFTTTIKVEGKTYESLELMVFDISGRVVTQKQTSQGNQIQFSKGNLEAGIYIYQLKGDGVLLNTGKIAVQ
jgi:uncharacterized repeat protein (TIGR01451 family)